MEYSDYQEFDARKRDIDLLADYSSASAVF